MLNLSIQRELYLEPFTQRKVLFSRAQYLLVNGSKGIGIPIFVLRLTKKFSQNIVGLRGGVQPNTRHVHDDRSAVSKSAVRTSDHEHDGRLFSSESRKLYTARVLVRICYQV